MTGPLDPTNPAPSVALSGGAPYGVFGSPFGVPLYNLPDFKRQAAFEAMTDAGLGLIKASAPSPYPIDGATLFGALAGGAAQGGRDAASHYMQRAMMGGQIRNMAIQQQMYGQLLNQPQPAPYDPYGGQGQPQPPQTQPGNGAMTAGAPNEFNIGNVRPPGGGPNSGFQQVPDFNSGVALAANTVRAYGNGKTIAQIGATYAPPNENDTAAWVKNVSAISGLPADQPLDLNDPQTAAALVRGIHGAEKGGNAVQPLGAYLPGVTGKFTPAQYTPPPGQGGAPLAIPPVPTPPNLSRYDRYLALGGPMAAWAKNHIDAEKLQYEGALKAREQALAAVKEQREAANADVLPGGQINQPKLAVTGEKKRVEAEAQEKARTNALYGGPGWEKQSPDDLRKQANPELVTIVDGVQAGRIRLDSIGQRSPASGVNFGEKDVQALGEKLYGKDWDPDAGIRRQKFMADATDTNTQTGKTLYAINTLYKHADQWQDLFLNIGNSESPAWNSVRKWLADNTGKSNYTTPEALSHAVGTELANVIKGQQLNMPEVEAAVESLRTTQSPKQGMDAINALMHAMQARESTMSFGARRAKVPDSDITNMIDPDARQAFSHFQQVQSEFRKAQAAKEGQGSGQPAAIPPPTQREVGKVYPTPKGNYIWTGQGWRAP